jgi:hypothetical protein
LEARQGQHAPLCALLEGAVTVRDHERVTTVKPWIVEREAGHTPVGAPYPQQLVRVVKRQTGRVSHDPTVVVVVATHARSHPTAAGFNARSGETNCIGDSLPLTPTAVIAFISTEIIYTLVTVSFVAIAVIAVINVTFTFTMTFSRIASIVIASVARREFVFNVPFTAMPSFLVVARGAPAYVVLCRVSAAAWI